MLKIVLVGVIALTTQQCAGSTQNTYGNGVYTVGVDIPPGLYQTSGWKHKPCAWSRRSGDGRYSNGAQRGRTALRVYRADKQVSFSGGCTWHKIG